MGYCENVPGGDDTWLARKELEPDRWVGEDVVHEKYPKLSSVRLASCCSNHRLDAEAFCADESGVPFPMFRTRMGAG